MNEEGKEGRGWERGRGGIEGGCGAMDMEGNGGELWVVQAVGFLLLGIVIYGHEKERDIWVAM